jgi:hypothetical protein
MGVINQLAPAPNKMDKMDHLREFLLVWPARIRYDTA